MVIFHFIDLVIDIWLVLKKSHFNSIIIIFEKFSIINNNKILDERIL